MGIGFAYQDEDVVGHLREFSDLRLTLVLWWGERKRLRAAGGRFCGVGKVYLLRPRSAEMCDWMVLSLVSG